jgi:prepilin-type N-terminal cleavage/methylation domain-containing protein
MKKKGFTLIELVVVMAIIAILSVIIVGAILAARNAATQTQRTGAVRTIETALESRAAKCNGMYFKASTNCGAALGATATISDVSSVLVDTGFLTKAVEIDNVDRFTVTRVDADNQYRIVALANDGITVLYEAAR